MYVLKAIDYPCASTKISYSGKAGNYILHIQDSTGQITSKPGFKTLPKNIVPGQIITDQVSIANLTQNINLKPAQSAETIVKNISFTGKAGEYVMHTTNAAGTTTSLSGIRVLPGNVKANQAITDPKIIEQLTKDINTKPIVESGETLLKGVRKAGDFEMGSGISRSFKGMNALGKTKVIGGVVAATAAGAFVVHQLFGGTHTNRVASERAVSHDLGRA